MEFSSIMFNLMKYAALFMVAVVVIYQIMFLIRNLSKKDSMSIQYTQYDEEEEEKEENIKQSYAEKKAAFIDPAGDIRIDKIIIADKGELLEDSPEGRQFGEKVEYQIIGSYEDGLLLLDNDPVNIVINKSRMADWHELSANPTIKDITNYKKKFPSDRYTQGKMIKYFCLPFEMISKVIVSNNIYNAHTAYIHYQSKDSILNASSELIYLDGKGIWKQPNKSIRMPFQMNLSIKDKLKMKASKNYKDDSTSPNKRYDYTVTFSSMQTRAMLIRDKYGIMDNKGHTPSFLEKRKQMKEERERNGHIEENDIDPNDGDGGDIDHEDVNMSEDLKN